MNLICMMCGKPALDRYEIDGRGWNVTEGEQWVYCRACDCWTSHPPENTDEPR